MLKEWVKGERPSDEEISERLEKARFELAKRQMVIKEKGLPVLVVMDGWGAAGKGSVIGRWKFVPEKVAAPALERDMALLFRM